MNIILGTVFDLVHSMKTMLMILLTTLMVCFIAPITINAQVTATATITATVLPSISVEIKKLNNDVEKATPLSIDIRGSGNILVIIDTRDNKLVEIFQLKTEKPIKLDTPFDTQTGKTTITFLSS